MANTFDDIYEVSVRVRLISEDMRRNGIFQTTLSGYILDFNVYSGITLSFRDAQPSYGDPIKLTKIKLYWSNIIDITVMPSRAQKYNKREYHQD